MNKLPKNSLGYGQRPVEGEWVRPRKRGYTFVCCDCGLAHRMDFDHVPHGRGRKVIIRAFRDEAATRRARKKIVPPAYTSALVGETCDRCGVRYDYCWQIPNEIWLDVVGIKEGHICLPCFTRLAHAKGHKRLCWDGQVETWASASPFGAANTRRRKPVKPKRKRTGIRRA